MKPYGIGFAVLMVALMVAAPASKGVEAVPDWLDMENCEMCKPLTAQPGLLEHLHWDNYPVATGMMVITRCEKEYEDAYKRVGVAMKMVQGRLAKGEQVRLCGSCLSFGDLLMAGAKMESFQTEVGEVMLVTAVEPSLIAKIRAHAERTNQEMKKQKESQKG